MKVGAVAALEVSRFARNSRDWQQLIEMCRGRRHGAGRSKRRCMHHDRGTIGCYWGSRAASLYELDLLRQRLPRCQHAMVEGAPWRVDRRLHQSAS